MSLSDAVLEVATQMEGVAKAFLEEKDAPSRFVGHTLQGFANQLRTAVKACEGSTPPNPSPLSDMRLLTPQAQHVVEIEKARQEFRRQKQKTEEDHEVSSAVVADGPVAGTDGVPLSVPINAGMPVGARTAVDNHVYELQADGQLHYVKPTT